MVLIFYDLETTGLITGDRHPSICQIGAVSSTGSMFSEYCMPDQAIDPGASQVNGLVINQEGRLTKHGRVLETESVVNVLQQFMNWIDSSYNSLSHSDVILIAHNGDRFDNPILKRACRVKGISFPKSVVDTADSIPMLKKALPRRRNYKLETLVREFLPKMDFEGHDAINDSVALKGLVEKLIGNEAKVRRSLGF